MPFALLSLHVLIFMRKQESEKHVLTSPLSIHLPFPSFLRVPGSAPEAHLLLPSLRFPWTFTFSSLCWIIPPARHMQESGHFNTLWGHHTPPNSALSSVLGCGQLSMPPPQLLYAG